MKSFYEMLKIVEVGMQQPNQNNNQQQQPKQNNNQTNQQTGQQKMQPNQQQPNQPNQQKTKIAIAQIEKILAGLLGAKT